MSKVTSALARARATARWATESALSRGPGYERLGIGTRFAEDEVAGYFLDFSAKTQAPSAATPAQLTPAGLVQLALGWWERAEGPGPERDAFLRTCELLLAAGERRDGALWWSYAMPVPKFGLTPPWHSALAQGQAGSAFVRAHLATGEDRWAEAALAAVAPLLAERGPLVTGTAAGPILEEAPSRPPSHILNGWITALFGVRDVAIGLGHAPARTVHDDSLNALREMLPAYDTGWWTRYSLYPSALEDLAKPIYQRLHADQAEVLHRVTGWREFGDAARRWREYDTPVAAARVVAQKALYVAADRGRRRHRSDPEPPGA